MRSVKWQNNQLFLLDQRFIPQKIVWRKITDYKIGFSAIKEMWVRGAPAIGITAAYVLALFASKNKEKNSQKFLKKLNKVGRYLITSRPTAVNLAWAIREILVAAKVRPSRGSDPKVAIVKKAIEIDQTNSEANKKMGEFGAELIKDGSTILTHCNTGFLATVEYGTALACIITAHKQGKKIKVLADETRPRLQGARLTVWELQKAGVPVRLITDSMAGYFMSRGEVSAVFVGADRIAANGDTANKIGTYTLSVLAKENKTPFYIVAPVSTIDFSLKSGKEIPIEEREKREVLYVGEKLIAPKGTKVCNPAFDVTPAKYITAIITEKEIIKRPFGKRLKKLSSFF